MTRAQISFLQQMAYKIFESELRNTRKPWPLDLKREKEKKAGWAFFIIGGWEKQKAFPVLMERLSKVE
ncbi:hypothetical protein TH63_12035 [Rufibacter radiotolerans]|uniref:Uncharacterized protein n=2 Tax=Rufibacter radiotolerans TaxID=1379910 RepID=A0A0H4VQH0_9BACT|nr:hypothetical protein TH63_12035 [Rufibacter radiotolerans]